MGVAYWAPNEKFPPSKALEWPQIAKQSNLPRYFEVAPFTRVDGESQTKKPDITACLNRGKLFPYSGSALPETIFQRTHLQGILRNSELTVAFARLTKNQFYGSRFWLQ